MTTWKGAAFDRSLFEAVTRRRLFFTEAFEIYRLGPNFQGDNRGLYDYGPPGCALQANIVDLWRRHFVLEENMLEVDCSVITPEPVLKASGHVDKFADWMCKDPVQGEYLRADHLVENVLRSRLARGVDGSDRHSPELEEATAAEYRAILAKVCYLALLCLLAILSLSAASWLADSLTRICGRLTTTTAPNSAT